MNTSFLEIEVYREEQICKYFRKDVEKLEYNCFKTGIYIVILTCSSIDLTINLTYKNLHAQVLSQRKWLSTLSAFDKFEYFGSF